MAISRTNVAPDSGWISVRCESGGVDLLAQVSMACNASLSLTPVPVPVSLNQHLAENSLTHRLVNSTLNATNQAFSRSQHFGWCCFGRCRKDGGAIRGERGGVVAVHNRLELPNVRQRDVAR